MFRPDLCSISAQISLYIIVFSVKVGRALEVKKRVLVANSSKIDFFAKSFHIHKIFKPRINFVDTRSKTGLQFCEDKAFLYALCPFFI